MRVVEINNYEGKLVFDNGYEIEVIHKKECCENNYADWSSLDDTGFYEENFKEILLERWEYGFRINQYAVNCYTLQNGYYNRMVEVRLKDGQGNVLQELLVEGEHIDG